MARPQVIINMAMTADGKTASATREYPRFTSPADRSRMERLRAGVDAILVGAETVRAIDPPLHLRDPELQAERRQAGKPTGLIHVVLSASGRVPPSCKALMEPSARARILATSEAAGAGADGFGPAVQVWVLGPERVDLEELLQRLSTLGVDRLLVEGGADTNGAFLDRDLVDELHLTIAPTLLGGRSAPQVVGGRGLTMACRRPLELLGLDREGDELFCHYRVLRPAPIRGTGQGG